MLIKWSSDKVQSLCQNIPCNQVRIIFVLTQLLSFHFQQIKEEKETTEKQQVSDLTKQLEKSKDEVKKSQNELDRLLEIMQQTEGEKHEKDKRIGELEK